MNPEVWVDPDPEPPVEAWKPSPGAKKMAAFLTAFAVFLGTVVFFTTREVPHPEVHGPWSGRFPEASFSKAQGSCYFSVDPEIYEVDPKGVTWYEENRRDALGRRDARWVRYELDHPNGVGVYECWSSSEPWIDPAE